MVKKFVRSKRKGKQNAGSQHRTWFYEIRSNTRVVIKIAKEFLQDLQSRLCHAIEQLDGGNVFSYRPQITSHGGLSDPRILAGSGPIEKAAINFSHSIGSSLPNAVSETRKNIAGSPFEAVSLSLIIHPCNPFVPTTHMNLRLFIVETEPTQWHFGGGYDLTPTYGFIEDATYWHAGAKRAAESNYQIMKRRCDEYFYLPHRDEHRGIGGLFFDDLASGDFNHTFARVQKIGESFLPLYTELFERRRFEPFDDKNRSFQLFRRGRYAEFNLLLDRGTRYGLQSGRRVENVLASMPPLASWVHEYPIEKGSPEQRLTDFFLKPRDWLATHNDEG